MRGPEVDLRDFEVTLKTFCLTRITLTVSITYYVVFVYGNQVNFNMTVFDERPRCHFTLAFGIQKNMIFGIAKASHFPI